MALTDRDLEQVGRYVQAHLYEWLPAPVIDLSERIVRVEDELRSQRELMQQGFAQMEKRFEQVEARFQDMNHRFNTLTWMIGVGFVVIATLMSLFAFFA